LQMSSVRYKVVTAEILSENAAKSAAQASSELISWLRQYAPTGHVLDYGCGKLRYFSPLVRSVRSLTLVDSELQLSRKQRIIGRLTSVRDYVRRWPHVRVLSVEQFEHDRRKYDFILCANVLSAIPVASTRNAVLRRLANALSKNGQCLFVTQYRNTYFKRIAQSSNATKHLDGWLLVTSRGAFYYGLIDKDKLVSLVKRCGFSVESAWVRGESAYVIAKPRTSRSGRTLTH